jgi:hypothetical protein
VTAELIWSWLRLGELVSGGEHYVDMQIGPPESPAVTSESQPAVEPSGQRVPSAEPPPEAPSTDAKSLDQTQTFEPFRTGAAGRPNVAVAVITEGKRRINKGEVQPTPRGFWGFCVTLCEWWDTERLKYGPATAPVRPKTVNNDKSLRELWNGKIKG